MAIPKWLYCKESTHKDMTTRLSSKPVTSQIKRVTWEIQMTTLCLEVVDESHDSMMRETYQRNAWEHVCLAIDGLGLPRVGFTKIEDSKRCCFQLFPTKDNHSLESYSPYRFKPQGVHRRFLPLWISRLYYRIIGTNSMKRIFSILSEEDAKYLMIILKLLLRLSHNKVLDQWWLLFNNFKYTSIGTKVNHDELLLSLREYLNETATKGSNR